MREIQHTRTNTLNPEFAQNLILLIPRRKMQYLLDQFASDHNKLYMKLNKKRFKKIENRTSK